MRASFNVLASFVALLALGVTGSARAGVVTWSYSATVEVAAGADDLGIGGQSLSLILTFDDAARWEASAGWLYATPAWAVASMTGSHVLSLNTADAAAAYGDGCCAAIVDAVGSLSYVDLIVDGQLTVMSGNGVGIAVGPAAGDAVVGAHLPVSLDTFSYFEYEDASGRRSRYDLVGESISIAERSVPEPGSSPLALSALMIALAAAQARSARRALVPS